MIFFFSTLGKLSAKALHVPWPLQPVLWSLQSCDKPHSSTTEPTSISFSYKIPTLLNFQLGWNCFLYYIISGMIIYVLVLGGKQC